MHSDAGLILEYVSLTTQIYQTKNAISIFFIRLTFRHSSRWLIKTWKSSASLHSEPAGKCCWPSQVSSLSNKQLGLSQYYYQ